MLLKCTRCGNTKQFIVLPEEYLYLTIADGEMNISYEDGHPASSTFEDVILCDECGCDRVEIAGEFWEKFGEAYGKFRRNR